VLKHKDIDNVMFPGETAGLRHELLGARENMGHSVSAQSQRQKLKDKVGRNPRKTVQEV
jgi:hypothetical protein